MTIVIWSGDNRNADPDNNSDDSNDGGDDHRTVWQLLREGCIH